MLTVSTLSAPALARRLAGAGVSFRTGPFVTRLRSAIPSLAEGIGLLYADYPLLDVDSYAHFHVALAAPRNLRRWLRPQVDFFHDGARPFQPLPLKQALPLFEWSMNWCISSHAHDHLIIHAAVLERDGVAVIMPAPPGSGKSTLCAALAHHGWRLLSDELTMVRLADGAIVPLPRPISLKNASIGIIGRYLPQAVMSTPVHDTTKGTVALLKAPRESVLRADETARPGWIIFPKYEADAAPALTPVPAARAFLQVAENCFNYGLTGERGFTALADLIDAAPCFHFRYSALDDALATFAHLAPSAP